MWYTFKHPSQESYVEVQQRMDAEHVYFDEEGLEWHRVYNAPQIAIKERIDPFKSDSYMEKTQDKNLTIGDVIDQSTELSQEREKLAGKDEFKESFFDDYAKKRHGKAHPDDKRNKKTEIKKNGFSVKFEDD